MSKICLSFCIIVLTFTFVILPFPGLVSGQQQPIGPKNTFISPYATLQFGPSFNESVSMFFRSAKFLGDTSNQTMTVIVPSSTMDNLATAQNLYPNDTLQPVFDSNFVYNRLLPQYIPKASNMSIGLAKVLNPLEAKRSVQVKLGPPESLPSASQGDVSIKAFSVPGHLPSGLYLVKLFVYFPEYRIQVSYSNAVFIHTKDRLTSLMEQYYNQSSTSKLNDTTNSSLRYSPS